MVKKGIMKNILWINGTQNEQKQIYMMTTNFNGSKNIHENRIAIFFRLLHNEKGDQSTNRI